MILTDERKAETYRNLVAGTEVLESSLHCGLLEHINAEVCLGTLKNIEATIRWLKSTFLYVRIKQNPKYYQMNEQSIGIDETLEVLCRKDINLLSQRGLVNISSEKYRITPYGEAMAKYYVRFQTSFVRLLSYALAYRLSVSFA